MSATLQSTFEWMDGMLHHDPVLRQELHGRAQEISHALRFTEQASLDQANLAARAMVGGFDESRRLVLESSQLPPHHQQSLLSMPVPTGVGVPPLLWGPHLDTYFSNQSTAAAHAFSMQAPAPAQARSNRPPASSASLGRPSRAPAVAPLARPTEPAQLAPPIGVQGKLKRKRRDRPSQSEVTSVAKKAKRAVASVSTGARASRQAG